MTSRSNCTVLFLLARARTELRKQGASQLGCLAKNRVHQEVQNGMNGTESALSHSHHEVTLRSLRAHLRLPQSASKGQIYPTCSACGLQTSRLRV